NHVAVQKFVLLTVVDSAPVLGAIADKSVVHPAVTTAISFTAADADDTLTTASLAVSVKTTAQAAFDLKMQLGLAKAGANFNPNVRLLGEKNFTGSGGKSYYILP